MSIGQRRIYISYKLGSRALHSQRHLWLLRQTLAHEIAHEIAGHANYSQVNFNRTSAERGITSRDLGYSGTSSFDRTQWRKNYRQTWMGCGTGERLQWDCAIWVRILKDF